MVNLGLGIVIGILVDQQLLSPAQATEDSMKPTSERPRPVGKHHTPHGGMASPKHKEMILKKLTNELQLDDARLESLSSLFDKHHSAEREFHRQMRQEMMQQRKTFMTEVETVLTTEQTQRFREIRLRIDHRRKEMMRMKRGGMHGARQGQRPERMPRRPELEE